MKTTQSTIPYPHAELGARIRAARKKAHLSHDALGDKCGMKRWHLIRLEKGQHEPRPATLAAIAVATGTTVEALEGSAASEDDEAAELVPALMNALRPLVGLILREQLRATA